MGVTTKSDRRLTSAMPPDQIDDSRVAIQPAALPARSDIEP